MFPLGVCGLTATKAGISTLTDLASTHERKPADLLHRRWATHLDFAHCPFP